LRRLRECRGVPNSNFAVPSDGNESAIGSESDAALLAHFAVPASRDFVRALHPLAADATTIELYDATRLEKL